MKKHKRLITNIIMVVLLLLLYDTQVIPLIFHEIAGITIFVLFAAHVLINRKWRAAPHKRLVTVSLGIAFAVVLVSGIIISHELFPWQEKAPHYPQAVHIASALIALVLSVVHAAQHRKSLLSALRDHKAVKVIVVSFLLALTAFLVIHICISFGRSVNGKKDDSSDRPGIYEHSEQKNEERK